MIGHYYYSLYYFMIIRVYRCLYVWRRHWKMYALLASVSCAQLITSMVENRLLTFVRFSKLIQLHTPPSPLDIRIVPKISLLPNRSKSQNCEYFNTTGSHLCNVVSRVITCVNSASVLLASLNVQAWLICYLPPARFKMSKSCLSLQCQLFQKVP